MQLVLVNHSAVEFFLYNFILNVFKFFYGIYFGNKWYTFVLENLMQI